MLVPSLMRLSLNILKDPATFVALFSFIFPFLFPSSLVLRVIDPEVTDGRLPFVEFFL